MIGCNPQIFDVKPIPHGSAVKTRDDLTLGPNKDPNIAYVGLDMGIIVLAKAAQDRLDIFVFGLVRDLYLVVQIPANPA